MSDDVSGEYLDAQRRKSQANIARFLNNDPSGQSFLDDVGDVASDVGGFVGETVQDFLPALAGGAIDGVEELTDSAKAHFADNQYELPYHFTPHEAAEWNAEVVPKLKEMFGEWEPEQTDIADIDVDSTGGKIVKSLAQFLTGTLPFAAAAAPIKAVSTGAKIGKSAASGAFSDAFAFDPDDPKIADMLKEQFPNLGGGIIEFLTTHPDDSDAEKRFKRALEGAGVGISVDLALHGFRGFRDWMRAGLEAKKSKIPLESGKEIATQSIEGFDNPLGDPNAPLFQASTATNSKPNLSEFPDFQGVNAVRLAPQESRLVDTPEGKYVALEDGSVDLGRFDDSIAKATGQPAAPIRLAEGNEKFGRVHLQKHAEGILKETGLEVDEFVFDILRDYNAYRVGSKNRIILGKKNGKEKIAVVELERKGNHYDVITAGFRHKGFMSKGEINGSRSQPRGAETHRSQETDATSGKDRDPSRLRLMDESHEPILSQDSLEINQLKLAPPESRLVDTPEGKYVALEDGSVDLSVIDDSIAEAIGQPAAPIRLAEGWDDPKIRAENKAKNRKGEAAVDDGLGLVHIQARHKEDILAIKGADGKPLYESVEEMVLDVARNYNASAKGYKDRLIIGKENGKTKMLILELDRTGDSYTVRSGGLRTKAWLKKQEGYQKLSPQDQADSLDAKAASVPSGQGDGSILSQDSLEINMAALNTPDDIDRLLTEVSETIAPQKEKARRGVRSNEVTEQAASERDMRVDRLLKRKAGTAFNAEQALAAREIHASSLKQIQALAKKAAGVTGSEVDQVAFLRALKVHSAIEAQIAGVRAEAGRALQQFRIIPKGNGKVADQISALLDSKQGNNAKSAAKALQNILANNPNGFPDAVAQMAKPNGFDMLYEIWINGLLSGAKTHVVNITSNALVPLWTISERALAGGMRKAVGGDGVELEEAAYMLNGMVKGYRDGFKLAAQSLRTGESSDVLQKIDALEHSAITAENFSGTLLGKGINKVSGGALNKDGYIAKGVNLLGHAARVPGRFLMAEDELFRAVGYRMELHSQALRMAKNEGLSGEDLGRRVGEILSDPPDEIYQLSLDNSRYQTFTNELGSTGKLAQKIANKLPGGRVVAPFIRTPTNIIKFFGERTPLAVAFPHVWSDLKAGGARADLALAKIGLGSMVMATVADMTLEGHVTGGGPTDKRQRALWLGMGNQPYSMKIGDTWYSYNRIEPLGMFLGVGADSAEIMAQTHDADQAQIDELAGAAVLSIIRNVSSKTYMQGITNLISAIDDPNGASLTYYLSSLSGSLVPAAVRQSNPDNVRRDSQGIVAQNGNRELDTWQSMINNIKSRTPGYSEDLPPRLNLWGQVIHYNEGLGPDFLSPIATSTQKQDAVNEELLRLGAPIGLPSKIVGGIRLHPQEYARYIELSGKVIADENGLTLKPYLAKLFKNPGYQRLDQDDQARVVRQVTDAYRKLAAEQLKKEKPPLRILIDKRKNERQ